MHLLKMDLRADFFGFQLADWIRWNLELTSYEVQGISWPELWENSLTPGRVWRSNSGPEW